jgi:hypothetical protein
MFFEDKTEWEPEIIAFEACDDVFDEKPMKTESSLEDDENNNNVGDSSNNTTGTSIESVSDHFHQLFDQLEAYMTSAPELDCIFIRRRVNKMKDGMRTINYMFEEVLNTGNRLERFLEERQNNKNSKRSGKSTAQRE